jgi:hypothetical protein
MKKMAYQIIWAQYFKLSDHLGEGAQGQALVHREDFNKSRQ